MLKVALEALERLLLHKYLCDNENESSRNLPEESKQLNDFIESPTEANLHKVVNDANIYSLTEKYIKYKERVLKGKLGKTAQFWARYMEGTHLVGDQTALCYSLYFMYFFYVASLTTL